MTEHKPEESSPSQKNSNRINALPLFAVILIVIFAISYKPSIEPVYCNQQNLSTQPAVIMLGTSWCPYCYQARKYFTENNISYCEYNIEDNGKGEQMYQRANTNPTIPLGIPVLYIGDYRYSGFDETRVAELLSKNKVK